jgi:hypothetical protein
MKPRGIGWLALAAAAAATAGSATLGLSLLRERLHAAHTSSEVGGGIASARAEDGTRRVELGPIGLRYFEGENSLRLTVEMASDRRGAYYIVYVWTARTWIREMPEWCRHRREEILAEIKRLTARERIDWVEED